MFGVVALLALICSAVALAITSLCWVLTKKSRVINWTIKGFVGSVVMLSILLASVAGQFLEL